MFSDPNKGISSIVYNELNLPLNINFKAIDINGKLTTRGIYYAYDSKGNKVLKIESTMWNMLTMTSITTKYSGNYVFKDNQLQFFSTPEGYATWNQSTGKFDYIYQFKDHLGNVRLSYTDKDKNGSVTATDIIDENHYYPFGLKHQGYNNVSGSGGNDVAKKYKFNGKEYEEALGLNVTEMDFRQYDNALGRFNCIDPLAELDYSGSPYSFGYNDPVYFADPSGLCPTCPKTGNVSGDHYYDDKTDLMYTYSDEYGWLMPDVEITRNAYEGNGGYVGGPTMYSLYDMGSSGGGGGSGSGSGGGGGFGGVGGTGIPAGAKFVDTSSQPGYMAYTANDVASFLQNTGDAAMVVGTIMVFTGVGAPLGALFITYGGYTSMAGTALELGNDIRNDTLTPEKAFTKIGMELLPMGGYKTFGSAAEGTMGFFKTPAAGELFNLGTIGADRLLDEFRNVNAGPYRKN